MPDTRLRPDTHAGTVINSVTDRLQSGIQLGWKRRGHRQAQIVVDLRRVHAQLGGAQQDQGARRRVLVLTQAADGCSV